jgi:hypothetical protein
MGFLDNSGDIILDAVLTDLGRKKLAGGSGEFNITHFALGDEEINYKLYDKNHPSGSAYYDLEIIQTPILESFTNNASSMKSTLMTLADDFLYLPVTKVNPFGSSITHSSENVHLVAVDKNTQGNDSAGGDDTSVGGNGKVDGVLFGFDPQSSESLIQVHQGIDNEEYTTPLAEDNFSETVYIIQIDGRFGSIVDKNGEIISSVQTDDDGMKFYTVNMEGNSTIVENLESSNVIAGSTGTKLSFKVQASDILKTNFSYFERFGFKKGINGEDGTLNSVSCIDTIIRITGVNYSYSVDIPVRFIKHL